MNRTVRSPSEACTRFFRATSLTRYLVAPVLSGALTLVMLAGVAHAKVSVCQFPPAGAPDPATLTITSKDGLPQSYDLVSGTWPDVDQVDLSHPNAHTLSCDIGRIDPTFIHFLSGTTIYNGWLCLNPRDSGLQPCKKGNIDCNGGDMLGFDILADSNIGHCVGKAGCKNKCKTFCENAGRKLYGSRCALSEQKCECRCIDRNAGLASGPGISQCYFGTHITLETDPECFGGPLNVLLDFGNHCFPMTTSSTTAVIQHADFTQSQIGPTDDTGAPISCNQLSSDISDTGMVLVGQVPVIFNPPAARDVMLSLHFPCVEATVKPTNTPRPTATATRTPNP